MESTSNFLNFSYFLCPLRMLSGTVSHTWQMYLVSNWEFKDISYKFRNYKRLLYKPWIFYLSKKFKQILKRLMNLTQLSGNKTICLAKLEILRKLSFSKSSWYFKLPSLKMWKPSYLTISVTHYHGAIVTMLRA